MADFENYHTVQFEKQNIYKASLTNAILRILPQDAPLKLQPFGHAFFENKFTLGLMLAGIPFQLELGSDEILLANPLLKSIPPESLPKEIIIAAAEQLLEPKISFLSNLLDSKIAIVSANDSFKTILSLDFTFKDQDYEIPLRLNFISLDALKKLQERLLNLKTAPNNLDFYIRLGFIAGEMNLNSAELQSLEIGDVLIPEDFYLAENKLKAHLGLNELCFELKNSQATLDSYSQKNFISQKDNNMSDSNNTIDPSSIDFKVKFELDNKLMKLNELNALKVGTVIAVGADMQSPIQVVVNDKCIASGKIVDLGGTLGIQITSLKA